MFRQNLKVFLFSQFWFFPDIKTFWNSTWDVHAKKAPRATLFVSEKNSWAPLGSFENRPASLIYF